MPSDATGARIYRFMIQEEDTEPAPLDSGFRLLDTGFEAQQNGFPNQLKNPYSTQHCHSINIGGKR